MPRIGVSSRGSAWVSMGCLGWLVAWVVLLPVITAWVLIKLVVFLVRLIVAVAQAVHEAPAVPAPLRSPPKRGP
jgi:uncharacterized membrane protein